MAEPPAPRPAAGPDVVEVACREFVELVTDHLEGALPPEVERAVAEHLELCDACRVYLEQIRATTAAARALPTPTLPAPARERLLDVFTALHGDGWPPGSSPSSSPS
ncbi:anti-sigma factor family protein [Geodermatophilus sp. SYSU D00766]